MTRRRVIITGLGTLSGYGIGAAAFWQGLCSGRSALRPITRFDPTGFRSRLASEVAGFASARDYVPKSYRKATKVMARDIELAVAAAKLGAEDAGLVTRGLLPEDSTAPTTYPAARLGCQIGAGLIAAEIDELTAAMATARGARDGGSTLDLRAWGTEDGGQGGMNNLPPLWMLKYLPNMLACHVTIIHGAEGPSNTITGTQASAHLCVGESSRVIERGAADACFSGGGEAPVNHSRVMRFELAGHLASTPAPEGDGVDGGAVVRPYDPGSGGSLLGEGAGILVLEEREAARARGASPYAEVLGFGSSQSGLAARSGRGRSFTPESRRIAIEKALADARLKPADIDAIVPQAAGTPHDDQAEAEALRGVFGPGLASIPLVTLTPAIGDCLAGNGGLTVAAAALAIRHQALPARIHGGTPRAGLQAGQAPSGPSVLRRVLVTTGSVGGQSAAIVLGRPEP